ncbi:alpha/beta hydrolase [Clostridium sp. YIM B02515]|uniref:Alpha/beta hydrolase n=1 Tax=Clostridium rhizosphaerae TaxID=2803861 RepID=A0ABS1TG55_9CLOT|nr:alpha/beta hydrolase [Clostridium rhizosphaerae]MBL4938275.1 alpha/beta hydrolase [Clostridium rhizosphaerae]
MINKSYIKVKTIWGYDTNNMLLTHLPKSDSIAVLFPGADYSCDKPLLHYARKAALLSGCDVLSLEYGFCRATNPVEGNPFNQIVKDSYEAVRLCVENKYNNIYFISKSFGTAVAGEVSSLVGYDKVNNLFLTPTEETIPYILRSKCTVISGERDKHFTQNNIDTIRKNSSVDLHIIDKAVHSLEIDDDYIESINILEYITKVCAKFVS